MNWSVICQARRDTDGDGRVRVTLSPHGQLQGDRMQPYLVEGDGAGESIDEFAGSDPSGRFVALIRDGRLYLRDTINRHEVDLSAFGADTRSDRSSELAHRAVSFDPSGNRVAYVRQHGQRQWVVVRDLSTGSESVLNPGSGLLWRLAYEPDGSFLRLQMVVSDGNGNRELEWPYPHDPERERACSGPVPSYNVWEFPGDAPTTRLLRLSDGKLLQVSGFAGTLGNGVITRNEIGELWLLLPAGQTLKVASEQCAARIYHTDVVSDSILFGCASAYGARRDMFIRTSAARKKLGFDLAAYEVDGRLPDHPAMLPLYPRNDAVLLDLEHAQVAALEPDSRVIGTHAKRALISLNGSLQFVRLSYADNKPQVATSALNVKRPSLARILQQGRMLSLGKLLFDLEELNFLGRFKEPPLALSNEGLGLLYAEPSPTKALTVRPGPLVWKKPEH